MDTANTLQTATQTDTTPLVVEVAPPADVILTPVEPEVRRHLWCGLCAETTVHTLENDCWYVCTNPKCKNQVRHVINDSKPLWAIR